MVWGAQTFMWMCEDNIVEVPFDKEHLLERILSPDNDAWIEDDVYGSDHCPVGLELDI